MGFLLSESSCNFDKANDKMKLPDPFFYNLKEPLKSFKLAKELKEISGIAILDRERILAVQDEDAIVYILTLNGGTIIKTIPFGEKGDFEAIAYDGKRCYVLRSDAVIFALQPENVDDLKVDIIYTDLDDIRNIYEYRLEEKVFNPNPIFSLNNQKLQDFISRMPVSEESFNFSKEWEANGSKMFIFPSDFAVHPHNGDIYISSSKGVNCIIVLNSEGNIKSLAHIPKSLLPQPEGLCFTQDGFLVISSEGKIKKERLYIFKPQNS